MSLGTEIPKIAITPENEEDGDDNLIEALTDVEPLDEEESENKIHKYKSPKKLKIRIKLDDNVCTTDLEDFEASDNEAENTGFIRHEMPISLDDLDLEGGTFEESFKTQVRTSKGKKKLKTQNSTIQREMKESNIQPINADDDSTDEEHFNTDSEVIPDDIPKSTMNLETYNFDAMRISEVERDTASEVISNSTYNFESEDCPENKQYLSMLSISPNLSDLTDVEVLYSDSNDEKDCKKNKSRRRRRRGVQKPSVTDVEDLELSDDEIKKKSHHKKSKKTRTGLFISRSQSLMVESDNEGDGYIPFPICKKIATQKVNSLKIPNFDINFMTDTEDIEDESDGIFTENVQPIDDSALEQKLNDMAACYSRTEDIQTEFKCSNVYKEALNRDTPNEQGKTVCVSFQADGTVRDEIKTGASSNWSTSFELKVPTSYQESVTDCEMLDSSPEEEPEIRLSSTLKKQSLDFTEEEGFESENEDTAYQIPDLQLPPSIRNLVILGENDSLPTVTILPLNDDFAEELLTDEYLGNATDEESLSDPEETLETPRCSFKATTPDMPPLDGGLITVSENFEQISKNMRDKSKYNEAITDTEEFFLERRKRNYRAPKFKYMHEKYMAMKNKLAAKNEQALLTDTEDIYSSDGNTESTVGNLLNPANTNDGTTDIENLDESSEEDKESFEIRPLSCTPQHMREIEGETVVLKEGSGSFSIQDRITVNKRIKRVKNTITSPTNTDTEEMIASADEDITGYSRSGTATPSQVHKELDQMSSSKVCAEVLKKFDSDAVSDIMYLKGGGYSETYTDSEDISDEDYKLPSISESDMSKLINEFFCRLINKEENITLNFQDGLLPVGTNEEWDASRKPAEPESKTLRQDAAQQGGEEATSSTTQQPSTSVRAEGEEAEKEESGFERRVPDQHQLSDEMKELLKELEKESKQ